MSDKKTGLTRRAFLYLSSMTALAAGPAGNAASLNNISSSSNKADEWNRLLSEVNQFPLLKSLFSRRSRRFGWDCRAGSQDRI